MCCGLAGLLIIWQCPCTSFALLPLGNRFFKDDHKFSGLPQIHFPWLITEPMLESIHYVAHFGPKYEEPDVP